MEIKYWSNLELEFTNNNIKLIENKINEIINNIFTIEFANNDIYKYEIRNENTDLVVHLYENDMSCFDNIVIDIKLNISHYDYDPHAYKDINNIIKNKMYAKAIELLSYINSLSQNNCMNELTSFIDTNNKIHSKYSTCISKYTNASLIKGTNIDEIREFIEYSINLDTRHDPFSGLISLKEASELYSKEESTLRRNISNGKFKEGIDCKKFGTTWVFNIEALKREYE